MIYKDRTGCQVEGKIWCPGPLNNTVWVINPENSPVVVHATKREEVSYIWPSYKDAITPELVQLAEEIIARHCEARKVFAACGMQVTSDIDPDHEAAVTILRMAEEARKSRMPFINAHGGKAPIGEKRFKEIAKEEGETP